jgi:hypothetical protein
MRRPVRRLCRARKISLAIGRPVAAPRPRRTRWSACRPRSPASDRPPTTTGCRRPRSGANPSCPVAPCRHQDRPQTGRSGTYTARRRPSGAPRHVLVSSTPGSRHDLLTAAPSVSGSCALPGGARLTAKPPRLLRIPARLQGSRGLALPPRKPPHGTQKVDAPLLPRVAPTPQPSRRPLREVRQGRTRLPWRRSPVSRNRSQSASGISAPRPTSGYISGPVVGSLVLRCTAAAPSTRRRKPPPSQNFGATLFLLGRGCRSVW